MIKAAINKTLKTLGYELHRIPKPKPSPVVVIPSFNKIHYGCGRNYMANWLNVDIISAGPPNYMYVDLISQHPFPSNSFKYAFSEDFLEGGFNYEVQL
jgi:hypothetical protein